MLPAQLIPALGSPLVTQFGRDFWLQPQHLVDGIAPGFFVDAIGQYMLNNQLVLPNAIFNLSSASGKTYIDASGVLRTAAANDIRRDFSSGVSEILFEGLATEVGQYTNTFSNALWSKDTATVTPNAGISPTGENNAWKLVANAGYNYSASNASVLSRFFSFTGALPWVWSIFVKAAELTQFRFRNNWTGGVTTINLTLTTNTANSIYVGNGWHLCYVIYTPATTSTNGISFRPFAAGTADGVGGVLIYGANHVQASALTSYIHNDGAGSMVRTADIIPFTTAAQDVLRGAGGAVAVRAVIPVSPVNNFRLVGASAATGGPHLVGPTMGSFIQAENWNSTAALTATRGGSTNWNSAGGAGACVSYGASGRNLCMSGGTVVSNSGLVNIGTTITIGNPFGLQDGQVVRLRQLVGWTLPNRATDAAVQAQARAA